MLPYSDLKSLQTPRQFLGDEVYAQLQDLLISIHRAGGTGLVRGEHPALIFDGAGGYVVKVNSALTTVL